jgi:hypothetical protein
MEMMDGELRKRKGVLVMNVKKMERESPSSSPLKG